MQKVALVTGGTRGIGLGIAEALARDGYALALCGRRRAEAVKEVLEGLQETGAEVLYVMADLASPAARAALVAAVQKHYGRLHLLVNNAGMAPRVRLDLLAATEASFEEVLRVNLQGPHFLTQAVARWMIDQSVDDAYAACIVNISSISATVASPSRGEYCISKAGLSMATRLWAVRLAEYGIPVYEVRPGLISTDMTAGVAERYDRLIGEGLLLQARWGLPADVGKAVALLARGDLSYATGHVLTIDGGLTLPRL